MKTHEKKKVIASQLEITKAILKMHAKYSLAERIKPETIDSEKLIGHLIEFFQGKATLDDLVATCQDLQKGFSERRKRAALPTPEPTQRL
ncbi:MAG: hypothetical protein GY765_33250 [bacterium]|nr:hypothetical protein [bacterium]